MTPESGSNSPTHGAREHSLGVCVTRVPALRDAAGAEIDVFGAGLAIELRREQADDVHLGLAAITRQFPHRLAVALGLGKPCRKFVDDMTQPMDLLLSGDLGPRSGWNIGRPYAG
jgi:hypothetical protein